MATSLAVAQALSDDEVAQLDPYAFFALLGKRVIHPGGRAATQRLIARAVPYLGFILVSGTRAPALEAN